MGKALGVLIAGIFVGAVGMELFRRQRPEVIDNLYSKTREMASGAKEAFKAGYEKVRQPEEPVPEPAI